jgi:hypothetical protein
MLVNHKSKITRLKKLFFLKTYMSIDKTAMIRNKRLRRKKLSKSQIIKIKYKNQKLLHFHTI